MFLLLGFPPQNGNGVLSSSIEQIFEFDPQLISYETAVTISYKLVSHEVVQFPLYHPLLVPLAAIWNDTVS